MDNWQRGFVLNRRAYSETSLLVDLFTENTGRLTVLAKGARRKNSPLKSLLQPFTPLLLRWTGKGSLKTLTKVESVALTLPLERVALYSGFYVNELLMRLLDLETSYPELFQDYLHCLTKLAKSSQQVESTLRTFEFQLLQHIGYGVDFCHCVGTGKKVENTMTYQYLTEKGFIASISKNNLIFYGRDLLAFAKKEFDSVETLAAAKRFSRLALKPYLGSQPLKSRELFSKQLLNTKLKG